MKILRFIFLLFCVSTQVFPQQQINISGTLLDADGSPVKEGIITAFQGPTFEKATIKHSDRPNGEGFFRLIEEWKAETTLWILFEERPDGFYPIADLELLDPKIFKGTIFSKYSKGNYLGNVRKYIQYGKAVVDISQLPESVLRKIKGQMIFVRVSDESGKVFGESSFARAVSEDGKRAVFNLPEGRWFVEFVDTADNNAIVMPKREFLVYHKEDLQTSCGENGDDTPIKYELSKVAAVSKDMTPNIYIYLDESDFNSANLSCVSRTVSKPYGDKPLSAVAFTDRAKLRQFAEAEKIGVPYFVDTPSGRESRKAWVDKYFPEAYYGYRRAFYTKNISGEFFYYDRCDTCEYPTTVVFRDSQKFDDPKEQLFYFVKHGYPDGVRDALAKGVDVNALDTDGSPAILWAAYVYQNEIAEILIEAGAAIDEVDNDGAAAIQYAAYAGNVDGVKLLLKHKANIDHQNNAGETALMAAAHNCHMDVVKLLVDSGAKLDLKDKKNKTALDNACENSTIRELLK